MAVGFVVGVITSSPATAITYNIVGQGAGIPLTGFITTNDHLGALSQSDITAWQITETGTSGPGILTTVNNTNSTVTLTGTALSATASALTFSFASSSPSILTFASNQLVSGKPAFALTYCDVGSHCTTPSITYQVNLTLSSTSGSFSQSRATGTSPIAVASVPVPIVGAGVPGLALSFGGALTYWRTRRRKAPH